MLARAVDRRAPKSPHPDGFLSSAAAPFPEDRLSSPPVLQRKIATKSSVVTKIDRGDTDLAAIAAAINAYNTSIKRPQSAADWTRCFTNLRRVWRGAYAWIDAHATGPGLLDAHAGVPRLRELISEAEAEHETLVQQTVGMDDVVPFDLGTAATKKARKARGKLWRDIVAGNGKIKLIGSDAFNRRILSDLAMMLETPTGRALLTFLNTPKDPQEDPASLAALLTNVYIGEHTAQLPKAVRDASPEIEELDHSEAQPLGIDEQRTAAAVVHATKTPVADSDDLADWPVVNDATTLHEITTAAWSGRAGFVSGGEKFTFAPGTGSFVTAVQGKSLLPGRDDREILSPSWVTLGHELGHAANIKAGAALVAEKPYEGSLTERLTIAPERDHRRWDNAEEMVNIENVENAMRREAGLSERDSHQTPRFVVNEIALVKAEIRKPINALYNNCANWDDKELLFNDHPQYTELERFRTVPAVELTDPAVIALWRRRLAAFLKRWTNGPADNPVPNKRLNKWFAEQLKLKQKRAPMAKTAKT